MSKKRNKSRYKNQVANQTNNTSQLTKSEVFDVMKMATRIYTKDIRGSFNTDISNANLKELNGGTSIPTLEGVDKSLANYKNNEKKLQRYCEFMEIFDSLFKNIITWYSGLLSFDLEIVCDNNYDHDYTNEDYLSDKKRFHKFIKSFNYEYYFPIVLHKCLIRDTYFTWFRTSEGTIDNEVEQEVYKIKKMPKYALQTMPQEFCTITEEWDKGFLYDFDMEYFNQYGVSIKGYDPIFRKYINRVYDNYGNDYKIGQPLNKRNGISNTKVQTSPEYGAWVFKLDSSTATITPFLCSMINTCLDDKFVEKLQKDKDMLSAYALVVGEIPLKDKQAGAKQSDALALDGDTLMRFMELVKQGLQKNINAVAVPTKSPKLYQFQDYNEKMYDNRLKTTAGKGASTSSMVYSSDKSSQSEIEAQIMNDFMFVEKMYRQFENMLNYYGNKKTKRYKFSCKFSGCTQPMIRDKINKNFRETASIGFVPNVSSWAKLFNMNPVDFEHSLEEAKYGNLQDLLVPLISIHTMKSTNNNGGRPESDDLSESGAVARDYE